MIVFGWRTKGTPEWAGVLHCAKCGEWGHHYGYRVNRTFTLFFLPILPLWSDTKVACQNCGYEKRLGPRDFTELGSLADFNRRLAILARDNPEEYERVVAELQSRRAPQLGEPGTEQNALIVQGRVCRECGTINRQADKFCISCGRPLVTGV